MGTCKKNGTWTIVAMYSINIGGQRVGGSKGQVPVRVPLLGEIKRNRKILTRQQKGELLEVYRKRIKPSFIVSLFVSGWQLYEN